MNTDPVHIERMQDRVVEVLTPLVRESEREGHRFVRRLSEEWASGQTRFDGSGEALFGARRGGVLVGVCGLNRDPYVSDPSAGRVRHLYVLPEARRRGVGTELVRTVIAAAKGRFARLDLRTRSPEAAAFYARCGFANVESPTATHRMLLETGARAAIPRRGVDLTASRFESWIDGQIREAEARGHFADLPGRGRPFENLTDDPDWWVKSKLRQEGLSFVPESLRLRREVEAWRARLPSLQQESAVRREIRELNDQIRQGNARITNGPPSNVAPLDEEAEVEKWRRARQRGV